LTNRFYPKPFHYTFAVLVVAVGLVLRWPFWEALEGKVPYMTFFPAVMLSAWRGGLGPGLLSTLLSVITALYFFIGPPGILAIHDWADAIGVGLFICTGAFMSWIAQQMHNARHSEERQRRISELTLSGIADGVLATDVDGNIRFMNGVAESLTGWRLAEAQNLPLARIFRLVSENTGHPVPDPVRKVLSGAIPRILRLRMRSLLKVI